MKKLGLVALAAVATLIMGLGLSGGTQTAQADIDDTRAIWCGWFAGTDVNGDDVPDNDVGDACDGLTQAELVNISEENTAGDDDDPEGLGDEDGSLEASDLDEIDLDANQLTDNDADTILVFAFVDDDDVITFDHDSGVTAAVNNDGVAAGVDDGIAETCESDDDNDCDNGNDDDGDGVAVATITEGTADAGDEVDVDVEQESDTGTEVLSIVGVADEVEIIAYEQRIQTSGSASDVDDCDDDADASDSDQLGDVEKTFVAATVTDNDGVELTRQLVDFSTDDVDVSIIGDVAAGGYTVDAGDIGTAAFAVVCGGDTTGTATVTAEIASEDNSVEIQVVGAPAAIALTAAPAAIICNGTNSSTVTATVTDADGELVAGLTNVNFSVVALGTASPINFGTVDGVASSQITPLAGTIAGVTVVVTSGDAEASILVGCNTPEAIVTAVVGTATAGGGVVTPPDTGNGGYLGQDSSSSFPLWTLIALGLGAVALIGGGVVARRAAK